VSLVLPPTEDHRADPLGDLLEDAPVILLWLDLDGRIERANAFLAQLTGWSLGELCGVDWFDALLPACDRETARAAFRSGVTASTTRDRVDAIVTRDGREREIEWHDRLRLDSAGTPMGVLSVGVDVTDRVKAEQALRLRQSELERSQEQLAERWETERALFESRQRFEMLVSVSPVGVFQTDAYGHRTFVNPRWCEIAGLTPEQAVGDGWRAAPHSDDRDRVVATWARIVSEGLPFREEYRFIRPDGSVTWVLGQAVPYRGSAGEIVGYIGTTTDITERKRIEDDLADAQTRVLRAEALAHVGSWAWNVTTGEMRWSPEMYRIYGVDPVEHPRPASDLALSHVHPDDLVVATGLRSGLLASGHLDLVELRVVRSDGEVRTVRSEAQLSRRDGVLYGFAQDVTDLRRTERELRRTRDLLLRVVDSSPDWIYAKDLEHRYLLVNEAFSRARGLSPSQMVGHSDTEFWTPEECEGDPVAGTRGFHEDDRAAAADQRVHRDNLVIVVGGAPRVLDTYKAPLQDEHGRPYGVLAYTRDVTHERHAAAELERSLGEKETLLREIHHRVKNNLQIVSSLLYFQSKKVRSAADAEAFSEARTRLLAMTLVHEKLYQSLELSRVEIGDYVRSLVAALSQTFDAGDRVRVDVHADELRLPLDVALPCGMIVCELTTNALKYAFPPPRTGHTTVTVRSVADGVMLTVEDDGVGFPVGFDPLAVVSFGWILVGKLCEQLGGTVVARSDRGAHVRVDFPCPTLRPRYASSSSRTRP
jgi:PAS domain S-box-containing protein